LEELYSYTSSTGFDNNLDLLLKEFLNNSQAGYKSREQKALVKATLARVFYIVAIIATNGGKSLFYLLTSSLSNSKVSIVIIPLVGLKLDIQKRALEFNIPTSIWEESSIFKNLTLISIETIASSSFIFQIQRLIN
jgi:superfamily II DNA helicase RecQ